MSVLNPILYNNRVNIYIKDELVNLPIQVVSIYPDKKNDIKNSFLFRCIFCGTQVIRVVGKVYSVVPGEEIYSDSLTLARCHKCRQDYTFVERGKRSLEIKVILTSNTMRSQFFCMGCYTPILEYTSEAVFTYPKGIKFDLPLRLPCPGVNCFRRYRFEDILHVV